MLELRTEDEDGEHAADPPTSGPTGPGADRHPAQPVAAAVALAVAIAESAAEIADTRPIPSWRASAYLYAAADQAWGSDGPGGPAGWRTDRTGSGGEFRFAVLLAEAATARFISGDGYLSNRQLATDLTAPPGSPPAPSSPSAAPPPSPPEPGSCGQRGDPFRSGRAPRTLEGPAGSARYWGQ